ncbi:hypothetical protein [Actinomadura flavalba]|uniref:hypothetical protein n=1 Tax=Actinomadura flavalba TaxID=1120938 RepID=UPI00035C6DA4|nr:hypothetical protein [Actinomadura flavalba]
MSARLHEALRDLAEEAPRTDLTDRVLAGARRRRRVRTVAAPVLAAAAAVIVAAGATLAGTTGGTPEPVTPANPPRTGIVNDGPLPPPLPKRHPEAITSAFLDHCKNPGGPNGKTPRGDCAQWRLTDRSGRQWRLSDGTGTYQTRVNDYMNGRGPLEISADGRRLAYYRADEQRFVVRDVPTGRVIPVRYPAPLADLLGNYHDLTFSRDGRYLAVSPDVTTTKRAVLFDTATGAVVPLPDGQLLGIRADGGVALATPRRGDERMRKATTLMLTGPDGRVLSRTTLDPRTELGTTGPALSPDGHTLLVRMKTRSMLDHAFADVRTGKVTRRLRLPEKVAQVAGSPTGWVGPTQVFTGSTKTGRGDASGEGIDGLFRITRSVIDLNTGHETRMQAFTLRANQIAFVSGGYLR